MFDRISEEILKELYVKGFSEGNLSRLEKCVYLYARRLDEDHPDDAPDRLPEEIVDLVWNLFGVRSSADTLVAAFDQAEAKMNDYIWDMVAAALNGRNSSDYDRHSAKNFVDLLEQSDSVASDFIWNLINKELRQRLSLEGND